MAWPRSALVGLAMLSGCAAPSFAWDPDVAGRAAQAEAEFRRWGDQRFEVLAFQAETPTTRVLTDDFDALSHLYVVPFAARIRFSVALEIEPLDRVQRRIGGPGWTAEGHRDAVMLEFSLGPREAVAGEELALRAKAVFEDLEPGTRFRAFDGAR